MPSTKTEDAKRLPPSMAPGVISSYDFIKYFFTAIVPQATLLQVDAKSLLHGHAEAVHLHPPTRAAEQAKRRVPADGAAATRAKKGKKAAQADEAAGLDVSAAPRAMLQLVQGISFDDWEEMLLPTREPTAASATLTERRR